MYRDFGPDYSLSVEYVVDPDDIELWYPATLGNPKLYNLELTLRVQGQDSKQLTWKEKVGFRTIVVDQSRYTADEVSNGVQPGTRFTFIVNGKPFYVQGSRYILIILPLIADSNIAAMRADIQLLTQINIQYDPDRQLCRSYKLHHHSMAP